jgi:hypothetical protein
MKEYAEFNRNFLLLVAGFLALIVPVNYLVDPYDVFGTRLLPHQFQINDRFNKIEAIKRRKGAFNSYIMGSSRALEIDPGRLESYLPESKFYNLAVTGATQEDHLKHLEYLLFNNYAVKNLYLQIDMDFLANHVGDHDYALLLHPDVTRQNRALYYVKYLTVLPTEHLKAKIQFNVTNRHHTMDVHNHCEIKTTGMCRSPFHEERIRKDPEQYIADEPSFHRHANREGHAEIAGNILALKTLKSLCDDHHVRCIFFTSPVYRTRMDQMNAHDYLEALAQISVITEFYDFGGYNTVTLDAHNYYESSHYRPHVGDLIAARIFGDPRIATPSDFGVRVTSNNKERHLRQVRWQIEQRDRERAEATK